MTTLETRACPGPACLPPRRAGRGAHLLVADDSRPVRDALDRALRLAGYDVELAVDGVDALRRAVVRRPDLVVLDVMMPRMSGLEACSRLRAGGEIPPILLLTARDSVTDRVAGLDAGADDYLTKPFALPELLARIRALLRRGAFAEQPLVLYLGDVVLDQRHQQVLRAGRTIELTWTEYKLLQILLQNSGRVLTRGELFGQVWGYDLAHNSNSLDVYIGYLRRKLEAHGGSRIVHTVRGTGFVARTSE